MEANEDAVAAPRSVRYPFDDEDADVLVLSSDDVYFKVYRVILSKASPVFKDMFGFPQSPPADQSPDDFSDGLPIVRPSEDSHTLELLFMFCYPMEDPILQSIDDVRAVLEAVHKYQMDVIAKRVRASWSAAAVKDSLRAFAVGCRMGWEDETRSAARLALNDPIWPLEPPLPEEFKYVSSENLLRLISYHRRCITVACGIAEDYAWGLDVLNSLVCPHCDQAHKSTTQVGLLSNWLRVYTASAKAIMLTQPSFETVANQNFIHDTIRRAYGCPPCDLPMHAFEKIKAVVKAFGEELDQRVASVALELQL